MTIGHILEFTLYAPKCTVAVCLMCVCVPDDSILRLLESRRGEKDVQVFVRKRRQREKQSQEERDQE